MNTLKAPPKKGRVTMHVDNDVITFFKMLAEKECCGYQTLMNAALRASMIEHLAIAEEARNPTATSVVIKEI